MVIVFFWLIWFNKLFFVDVIVEVVNVKVVNVIIDNFFNIIKFLVLNKIIFVWMYG